MRIYIIHPSKEARGIDIDQCTTTTQLLACLASAVPINAVITLRSTPHRLRIIPGWSISLYNISNGSVFDVTPLSTMNSIGNSTVNGIVNRTVNANHTTDHTLQTLLEAGRTNNLTILSVTLSKETLNARGRCGRTILHWGVHMKHSDVVSYMLMKGADPNTLTTDDYTPLQLAVIHRAYFILQCLVKHSNINQLTTRGTALHIAHRNKDHSSIKILLDAGASYDIPDFQGNVVGKIQEHAMKRTALIPNIGKGQVVKVSSLINRRKECQLIVNAFKNELKIDGETYSLEQCKGQQITERSFFMKSDLMYLRIVMRKNSVIIGIKHRQILERWMEIVRQSESFVRNKVAVSKEQQIIEILDDKMNQVELYKRKVDHKNILDFRKSIMDIDHAPTYRNSELLLGSVLNIQQFNKEGESFLISLQDKEEENQTDAQEMKKNGNFYKDKQILQHKFFISLKDFILGKLINKDTYSKTYIAKHKPSNKIYAIKAMNKKTLILNKLLKNIINESTFLKRCYHPFIIHLQYCFQTTNNLFFVLQYCPHPFKCLSSPKQTISQLILAVECMHSQGISHGAIKAQNILIGRNRGIRVMNLMGPPNGKGNDIYALGCLLYQMLVGEAPNTNSTIKYPADIDKEARGLLTGMLEKEENKRITLQQIKAHQYFKKTHWEDILSQYSHSEDYVEDQQEYMLGKTNTLNDLDYEDRGDMLNRIKNFTFIRN